MKKVEAFECERTGGIFKRREEAARSEFKALMRHASQGVCAMGSIGSDKIYEWLTFELSAGIYPTALPRLLDALKYLQSNYFLITGKEPAP